MLLPVNFQASTGGKQEKIACPCCRGRNKRTEEATKSVEEAAKRAEEESVEAWKFAGDNSKGFSLVNVPN